jgi:hypothetical protein
VPSILESKIEVQLDSFSYFIDIYQNSFTDKWLLALERNLANKLILEKNFCFLGFPDSPRNIDFLCDELNQASAVINSFNFKPEYKVKQDYKKQDFQDFDLALKHDTCNLLHRYFEDLQGTAWNLSDLYKQADYDTKYAIRQLNNLCHEIESWVLAYRKQVLDPDWIRPSQITTFLNAPRKELEPQDFELFKINRYDRDFGGVYLHWSQVGKTLFEVFRDEDGNKLDEATCSAINHQQFYSGEFDVEWGNTINEQNAFKKKEMDEFREWLKLNNFDWDDPKLALGYIKLGQVDLAKSFGSSDFKKVYEQLSKNLDIKSIKIDGGQSGTFDYSLGDEKWITIQKQFLKPGYDWSSKNG